MRNRNAKAGSRWIAGALLLASAGIVQAQEGFVLPADPANLRILPLLYDLGAPAAETKKPESKSDPKAGTPKAEPAAPPVPVVNQSILRHLPNSAQGFRIIGEIGGGEWPVFLTDAQSKQTLRFRVGYVASVAVMPEASSLTLWINDKVVGRTRIAAPLGVRTTEFEIPAGLLQYGFNSVRLGVEQRHRVDCSLQATYELWTQIDPSQTGLVLPAEDPGVEKLADLAALSADAQGALPIRAVIQKKAGPKSIEKIIEAAQMISLSGRFDQPLVEFGPLAGGDHGINLIVGTEQEIAALPGLEGAVAPGKRVTVLRATPTRRTSVIVTGKTPDDLAESLALLTATAKPLGSVAGIRAATAFPGYRMEGGTRVRFRDFGINTQEFGGRFFRASANVMMPPDFYPADYGKMIISLDGGYAAGLKQGSEIVVTVNDRTAANLNLPRTSGEVFQGSQIPIPLGLLRPGLNRIEIQAHVPRPADRDCDPLASLEDKRRFLLLESSEIIVPPLARIARMPNLAVTTTGAFPYAAESAARPKLFVPAPDRNTMSAAATLAARLSVSAGVAMPFELTLTAPRPGSGPTLVVSSLRSLNEDVATTSGIDIQKARQAWRPRMEGTEVSDTAFSATEIAMRRRFAMQRNLPAACTYPNRGVLLAARAPVSVPVQPVSSSTGKNGRSLLDEWKEDVTGGSWWTRAWTFVRDTATQAGRGASDWTRETASGWMKPVAPPPSVSARTSLIVSQHIAGGSTNDVWTFVLAPTSQALSEAVNCLVDPRIWQQVDGRVSYLDASEARVETLPAEDLKFISTQPLSVANLRLVLASWLSLNQFAFVGIMLLLACVLSGSTRSLLRNLGRKS